MEKCGLICHMKKGMIIQRLLRKRIVEAKDNGRKRGWTSSKNASPMSEVCYGHILFKVL